jgi:demethylmenaquinone methyltransferase / 2-methoxy-6-polyprenyl-1,4-benzoquinol methylase
LRFQARVVGADFTEEMLRIAAARGHNEVSWIRADALRLPFADNSFDAVSVGYGLRNLADIEQGLREILRVLRPGGKFVTLDFGKPESPFVRALYFGYLRMALPILGRLFCGDPDTHGYILTSLQNYPAQRGIKQLMETQGWRDCGFEEFWFGSMSINYGSKPR